MTTEERDIRLTAYALNDPSLNTVARDEIEASLAGDASARQAVEETRQLAQVLTDGLAAEQSALPKAKPVTIPASLKTPVVDRRWTKSIVAVSVVLMIFSSGVAVGTKWYSDHRESERSLSLASSQGEENGRQGQANMRNGYPAGGFSGGGVGGGGFGGGQGGGFQGGGSGGTGNVTQAPSFSNATGGASREEGAPKDGKDGGKGEKSVDALTTPGERGAGTTAKPIAPGPGAPGFGGEAGIPGGLGGPGGPPAAGYPRVPGGMPGMPGTPGGPRGPVVKNQFSPPKPDSSAPEGTVVRRAVPPDDLKDLKELESKKFKGIKDLPAATDPRSGEDLAPESRDKHLQLIENSFTNTQGMNAVSTFGVDVDTASYAIVRKYLSMGQLPPTNSVRLEEMVNYFPYSDKPPQGDDPFAVTVEMAECPWEPAHRLVRLGLKAKTIDVDKRPPSNLVFLVDVSGSMNEPNKLPLVKASLKLLVNQLGENDRVALVVYAGNSGLVLDSTSALKREKILSALDVLEAGGSTNGAGGMQQAYDVAVANFVKGGTNRVILCTDGDWNVGTTSTEALVKMVELKRQTGVFLSVFGFGMGNLRDEMMVQLAGKGNGNYGYIDTIKEANKALVEQLGGTLVTIAKDVKIQVEFNPAVIKSYRLLGYEKRALAAKDFHDDKKDAGEMGAGHVVTALYELVPAGVVDPAVGKVDGLRYQQEPAVKPAVKGDKLHEAFVVKMRHKKPDSDTSTLRELPVSDVTKHFEKTSEDFQFASAVAAFAMVLRDSAYKGNANFALVLELAESAKKRDAAAHGEYRTEFIELVKKAKMLSGKE